MCGCEKQELRSPFPNRKQEFASTPTKTYNIKKSRHYVDHGPVTGFFENGTEPASFIRGRDCLLTICETLPALSVQICLVERYTMATVTVESKDCSVFILEFSRPSNLLNNTTETS
jgi:hypothetical protein